MYAQMNRMAAKAIATPIAINAQPKRRRLSRLTIRRHSSKTACLIEAILATLNLDSCTVGPLSQLNDVKTLFALLQEVERC